MLQDAIAQSLETAVETAHPLPFVNGRNLWAPDREGNYDAQVARGRAYAEALMGEIRQHQNPALFGHVVRAISAGGTYGPVEIGFCSRIGIELAGLA